MLTAECRAAVGRSYAYWLFRDIEESHAARQYDACHRLPSLGVFTAFSEFHAIGPCDVFIRHGTLWICVLTVNVGLHSSRFVTTCQIIRLFKHGLVSHGPLPSESSSVGASSCMHGARIIGVGFYFLRLHVVLEVARAAEVCSTDIGLHEYRSIDCFTEFWTP